MGRLAGLVLALGVSAFVVALAGQGSREPSEALVTEVRLLRQSIEKIGGQSGQVQIALGRLSAAQTAIRDLSARISAAMQYSNSMAIPAETRQRYQEEVATLQQQMVIEQSRMADAQKYLDELQREMRR